MKIIKPKIPLSHEKPNCGERSNLLKIQKMQALWSSDVMSIAANCSQKWKYFTYTYIQENWSDLPKKVFTKVVKGQIDHEMLQKARMVDIL